MKANQLILDVAKMFNNNYVGVEVSKGFPIAKLSRIVKEVMGQRFINYKENVENFVYGYSFVGYKLRPIFIIFDELGVFCVLSTQQPNANNIPTELRDNLSEGLLWVL